MSGCLIKLRRRRLKKCLLQIAIIAVTVNLVVASIFIITHGFSNRYRDKYYKYQCEWMSELRSNKSDIEISKLIDELSFDDIDGGVWKQGFDIKYDDKQWTEDEKLHVVIIPHSHNDPGWLMTFEQYFEQRTKNILNTVVEALEGNKTRKFVWAETSYMSLWWNEASEEMRSRMRRLIVDTKQLEIVTGGWVMTDEANSHYYAMIEQMIEGHEWLRANIDKSIRPQYGWSIDPFGYTPTMAYLLKQMGFEGMLIQRVHYHLKKYLSKENRLEFMWKQSWSTHESKDTSILCHIMPFYFYDIPHTCGPDPKICCQFDFLRDRDPYFCPWGIPPQPINQENVEERAWTLLDQYRKKSQLYGGENKHNVVLIPLGDDFRWQDMSEANDQYLNYEMLINYMNSRKDWNVDIRFGTLSDYFELLKQQSEKKNKRFETLSGDFFTYADRQDNYWSGYFTSRVFYKRLDRLVEYYLRNAEIVFSLSNLAQISRENKFNVANKLYKQLLVARRNLGLFQHHDGITGTSKTYVVNDYANKLYTALGNSKNIIEQSLAYLLTPDNISPINNLLDIDDIRISSKKDNEANYIYLTDESPSQRVVVFNSLLQKRNEIVSIRINKANVQVFNEEDNSLIENVQVSLIWPNSEGGSLNQLPIPNKSIKEQTEPSLSFNQDLYELLFEISIEGLSSKSFKIQINNDNNNLIKTNPNTVSYYFKNFTNENAENIKSEFLRKQQVKITELDINMINKGNEDFFTLKMSKNYEAKFSMRTGFLDKFIEKSKTKEVKSRIKLIKYGTTNSPEKSGAYLFLPDRQATDIDPNLLRWIRVEHGNKLRDRVCVNYTIVLHCVEIYHSQLNDQVLKMPLLNIWNVVDLRQTHNYELSMHIETDIDNKNSIYTDLNGFQYVKRRGFLSKLTIQGNVYPMPTGAFIQDDSMRLSVLTGQPVGVASLEKGSIQFFLDRRLDQDDNRGMEQAMNDNVVVSSRFLLLFESIVQGHPNQNSNELERLSLPSITSQSLSNNLLNPLLKLIVKNAYTKVEFFGNRRFLETQAPCDLHLVNLRTMQNDKEEPVSGQVGLILHRFAHNDCKQTSESIQSAYVDSSSFIKHMCSSSNSFSFVDFFKSHLSPRSMKIANTFLTLTPKDVFTEDDFYHIHSKDNIVKYVQPMQIEAFRIDFG